MAKTQELMSGEMLAEVPAAKPPEAKPKTPAAPAAISVAALVGQSKTLLEKNFAPLWVVGEVVGFKRYPSGHCYFTLRDAEAMVSCVMFSRYTRQLPGEVNEGGKVLVLGQPTVYAPSGKFQINVTQLRFEGVGQLHQIFMQRKQQWQKNGWFDSARKKAIPMLPKQIGVVCSTAGAALRDILKTHHLRLPTVPVVVYPAPAQGTDASAKIAAAIAIANKRAECDVLLVCRGGGGIEDLWAYNEEPTVRAIVDSRISVITGIGHEVDETLADYAADVRCATPTAAAARAVPDGAQLHQQLDDYDNRARQSLYHRLNHYRERLNSFARAIGSPKQYLQQQKEQLRQLQRRLQQAVRHRTQSFAERISNYQRQIARPDLQPYRTRLAHLQNRLQEKAEVVLRDRQATLKNYDDQLQLLSPERVLERGYSIVYNAKKQVITDASQAAAREKLRIVLSRGDLSATVDGKKQQTDLFDE